MNSNQENILSFLSDYFQFLEQDKSSSHIRILKKDEKKETIHYQLSEGHQVLIFDNIRESYSSKIPFRTHLDNSKISLEEFWTFTHGFVDKIGGDINGLEYSQSWEMNEPREWYSRYWCFDEFHESLRTYPDENGYTIIFFYYKMKANMMISTLR